LRQLKIRFRPASEDAKDTTTFATDAFFNELQGFGDCLGIVRGVRLGARCCEGEKSHAEKAIHFQTMVQADLPQGRNGKHREIVTTILSDLDRLSTGSALKVPLADLVESKEKVRSALNRATRRAGRKVMTASDTNYLYVWNGDN
jgi:hypothetical protein